MNKYLEKIAIDYLHMQAADDVGDDHIFYRGKVVPGSDNKARQRITSKFSDFNYSSLHEGPKHSIRGENGHLTVEVHAKNRANGRIAPIRFALEDRARFGKYPTIEEFRSQIEQAHKISPVELSHSSVQEAIEGYGHFLKKRRLKIGLASGAIALGAAAGVYAGSKYLEKIAEKKREGHWSNLAYIPLDGTQIPISDYSPEQLQELFKIFKLLPGDSPLGQPGRVTKFVRTKLRE